MIKRMIKMKNCKQTHFFLYNAKKIFMEENGVETDKVLGIEYIVLSTDTFNLCTVFTADQEIDIPEPDGNNLVELVFEDLLFFLFDADEEREEGWEGVAKAVASVKTLPLTA